MSSYSISIFIVVFFVLTGNLLAQDSFEEFQRQQQQRFNTFTTTQEQSFEEYTARQDSLFQAFRTEMEAKWGSFQERTQTIWTQYNEDGNSRWEVDFEEGRATVEVIADATNEEAVNRLRMQLIQMLLNQGTETGMPDDNSVVQDEPILANQVEIVGDTVEEYVERIVRENMETETVQTEASESSVIIFRVNLDLAPNHINTRASRFAPIIEKYAEQYNLSPALVLAIMHTESYFNPMAVSHANALGLMQLVPTSGGRDAHRFVYGRDGIPQRDYLFTPENNIKFGTAYLHILLNNYLRAVTDQDVRTLLAISSYNTGVGNTARAYTGTTNFRTAAPVINRMPKDEHFEHLRKNLPYQETRDYIQKVTERKRNYEQWLEESQGN